MSTLKTATSALTAIALVSGIGFAWAQTEDQNPSTNSTTAATAPSEQTPADPNAAPLTGNSAAMQQQTTTPPPVDSTTPAPQSTDANSQAPLNNSTSMSNSSSVDNSTSATPSSDYSSSSSSSSSYEPAPRADRN